MRKTIKKLVTTALLVTSIVATTMAVNAGEEMAAYKDSNATIAGYWSERTTAQRLKADTETAMGKDAYAYFIEGSVLPNTFSEQTRNMEVKLMELDENNADDHVKTYYIQYDKRKFNKVLVSLGESHIKGMLEAEGDEYAELYITYYLEKKSGDAIFPVAPVGHFKYKFGMQ